MWKQVSQALFGRRRARRAERAADAAALNAAWIAGRHVAAEYRAERAARRRGHRGGAARMTVQPPPAPVPGMPVISTRPSAGPPPEAG